MKCPPYVYWNLPVSALLLFLSVAQASLRDECSLADERPNWGTTLEDQANRIRRERENRAMLWMATKRQEVSYEKVSGFMLPELLRTDMHAACVLAKNSLRSILEIDRAGEGAPGRAVAIVATLKMIQPDNHHIAGFELHDGRRIAVVSPRFFLPQEIGVTYELIGYLGTLSIETVSLGIATISEVMPGGADRLIALYFGRPKKMASKKHDRPRL